MSQLCHPGKCSYNVPMSTFMHSWPRPPHALPHARLNEPPNGARVCVAGLVLVRQRPGTANGVIFLTLEDETGISNIIVWRKVHERFRRAVVSGRCLRITGKLQRESGVVQIIAEVIEDISPMLDELARPPADNALETERAG